MISATAPSAQSGFLLSATEQALWLFQQFAPEGGVLNVAFAFECPPGMRQSAVRAALNHLSRRHPALRSVFAETDGTPQRIVLDPGDRRSLPPLDLIASSTSSLDEDLTRYADLPFDSASTVPLRVGLLATGSADVLCFVVSHLVCDAYSLAILRLEFLRLYEPIAAGQPVPADLAGVVTAPPPVVVDPRSVRYWQERLAGAADGRKDLVIGRPGRRAPDFPGAAVTRELSDAAVSALGNLSRSLSVGPSVVALALYACLLARHGMDDEVVVGMPVQTRGARPHQAVGLYLSFVAARLRVDLRRGFAHLVRDSHEAFLSAMLHSSASLDDVFPGYDGHRRGGRPLFRHMFNFTSHVLDEISDPGVMAVSMVPVVPCRSRVDLELVLGQRGDGYELSAIYATDVFERAEVIALLARYEQLLRSCGARPDLAVGDLPLWTEGDRALVGQASARAHDPVERTIDQEVISRCLREPGTLAVSQGGITLARADLARAVAAGSALMRDRGIGSGHVVAVPATADASFVIAVLSAWAAGAAALPWMAHGQPDAVGAEAAGRAGAAAVPELAELVGRLLAAAPGRDHHLATDGAATPALVPSSAVLGGLALLAPDPGAGPDRPIARITHQALATVVGDLVRRLEIGEQDVVAWLASADAGDLPIEPMLALAAGARLLIAAARPGHDPAGALELAQAGASVLVLAPLALARLLDAAAHVPLPPGLRVLCRGVGPLSALADRALDAGVVVTWVADAPGAVGPVLAAQVGSEGARWLPTAGTRAFVVSPAGQEIPPGLRGSLCLSGPAVADGYLRSPRQAGWQLDIDHLGNAVLRSPLTASWAMDGTLRLHQHGKDLIAPAVEAALAGQPQVRWAQAVALGDGSLVCGVETRQPPGPGTARALAEFLPEDAVGVRLMTTDKLPASPDGTVDVRALLAWASSDSGDSAPPSGDGQDQATADLIVGLVGIWQSVLGSSSLGPDANFFHSGGDSMLASRLVAQIRRRYGLKVSLRTVFHAPTPARLAARLARLPAATPR